MFVVAAGLNHRTAPVAVREQLAFAGHGLPAALCKLKGETGVAGCVILSTCNRTEVYVACNQEETGLRAAKNFLGRSCHLAAAELEGYLYTFNTHHAVRHLFRVAAGLDSMILGEDQVLAQVAEAYQVARETGTTNNVLNTLWQQAITAGKRVRTETRIDANTVSVSYAAVELARQVFNGDLAGRTVLVIGAGKMSTLAARYLKDKGVTTVLVSNRSYDRAVALAETIGGRAIRLDALEDYLCRADIVISCTAASHYILHREQVDRAVAARPGVPLMLIDIAVPRDIEPAAADLPGVKLYDIDDLQQVVLANLEERKKAARQAETIVAAEVEAFFRWLGSLYVVPTIVALKEKAGAIKEAEVRRACNRLGELTPRQQKIIATMANTIVNQLLHEAVVNLKTAALTSRGHLYAEALQQLFGLQVKDAQSAGEMAARVEGGRQF
ncbi:glutamyl-tRNA reductase [Moorella sp. Hama-1]|uniref:glutamyl-tRNA reductase n=1 Tax=Moorella sp. Hama-1 TaxID=2138101 RepID=UPI000D65E362|nr:glutamyl-tRNA reductase [Moorella sp. Hama-1]MDN5361650.1 glutamyl-tRNA reductase [Moorella sp. (in: firmicutes)]BCV21381.1 glutamyl-tRNA reductase [Moorella sp. Hama-1]